ncbi:MAG TPA: hypothetical protein VKT72_03130 [Candidatus Baltobacteraceae bacterium]|nr:hypothetical protein [Candidatus Baltobacteraceae bacterium]
MLVALAASCAALLAHIAIDVLGDFMLAHDTYDGVSHGSRAISIVAIAIVALALVLRMAFVLIDRGCASRTTVTCSVRRALGPSLFFSLQTSFAAVVLLAGMEYFDCAGAHVSIAAISQLFGGSMVLGLGTTVAAGLCGGFIIHRLARILTDYEPQLVALMMRLIPAASAREAALPASIVTCDCIATAYALLLSRCGGKRGPPAATPV